MLVGVFAFPRNPAKATSASQCLYERLPHTIWHDVCFPLGRTAFSQHPWPPFGVLPRQAAAAAMCRACHWSA